MIGDDEWNTVVLMHQPTKLSYRRFCLEKSLRSERPERNDNFWFYKLELPHQVRTAGSYLVRQRISVSRRSVFEHIADEDILPLEIDGGALLPRV